MTIEEMHIDFLMNLNKGSGQVHKEFMIPEVDFYLNKALMWFITSTISQNKFEVTQHITDSLKNLIVEANSLPIIGTVLSLPGDYLHYISCVVSVSKDNCGIIDIRLNIREHDDDFESNILYKSSYRFRQLNAVFNREGIRIYPGDTTLELARLNYVAKHPWMHYAEGYGGYKNPNGVLLTGKQDCILDVNCHEIIIKKAVELAKESLKK